VICPDCRGSGEIKNPDATSCEPQYIECPKCHGTGHLLENGMNPTDDLLARMKAAVDAKFPGWLDTIQRNQGEGVVVDLGGADRPLLLSTLNGWLAAHGYLEPDGKTPVVLT
jgi:hypothetical protein